MTRLGVLLPLVALFGCDPEEDVVWRQFNGNSDIVQIEVTPGEPAGVAFVDLTSNTGVVVVGTATVTPARGPVGTSHTLVIEVDDEWGPRLGRASVSSEGARGDEAYDLLQDTARPGVFELVLTSLGAVGESRTDSWRIAVFEPDDTPNASSEQDQ